MAEQEITSRLWKASVISQSPVFEKLVRAACARVDVAYSADVLEYVVSANVVVDAIPVYTTGSVDQSLLNLVVERGTVVDKTVTMLVSAYRPPVTQVGLTASIVASLAVIPGE